MESSNPSACAARVCAPTMAISFPSPIRPWATLSSPDSPAAPLKVVRPHRSGGLLETDSKKTGFDQRSLIYRPSSYVERIPLEVLFPKRQSLGVELGSGDGALLV